MAIKHVRPGDAFPTGADRLNQTADAVNWVQRRQREVTAEPDGRLYEPDRILIRNGSCEDWEEFDAIQLHSPAVRPNQQLRTWAEGKPIYLGVVPESANARIAILEEPCPACSTRRAIVSGLARTKIDIVSTSHRWATIVAGSTRLVSTSSTTAPAEIIWAEPGTGERYADVLLSLRRTAPAPAVTTTTLDSLPDALTPICSGQAKWIWSAAACEWLLDSDPCAPATTTTAAPTTTTTGETTTTEEPTTTTPCCDFDERYQVDSSTTTTPDPGTTTTPEDCQPLYPSFCGTLDGECTYTYCSTMSNNPPDCKCGTTTTSTPSGPTTTTTCDCTAVQPPDGCTLGCEWIGVPGSGCEWEWKKVSDGCGPGCPCSAPGGDPFCATSHTNCVVGTPTTPPEEPFCSGQCVLWYLPSLGKFYQAEISCRHSSSITDCGCAKPTIVGDSCDPYVVPCVSSYVPPSTTTTAAGGEVDPCVYICHGTGVPPAPTTTTTAATCLNSSCLWKSNAKATGWVGPFNDTCPTGCYCAQPGRDPIDDCETAVGSCTGSPPTTTTQAPTTTTTAEPTTTTQGPTTSTTCGCGLHPTNWVNPAGGGDCRCGWIACGGTLILCYDTCSECSPPNLGCFDVDDCGDTSHWADGGTCFADCGSPTTTTPEPTTTTPEPTTTPHGDATTTTLPQATPP